MQSWGKLPLNMIDTWDVRRCDLAFTAVRMSKIPISTCMDNDMNKELNKNFNQLPYIAILAGTTTRKIENPSTDNLSLFMFMLPSLIRTLSCGYRYMYVLGFDKGDPFYDSEEVCLLCVFHIYFRNKTLYLSAICLRLNSTKRR